MTKTQQRIFVGTTLIFMFFLGYALKTTSYPTASRTQNEHAEIERKAGYPDLFAEYLNDIKTAAWEDGPSYPQNYLMDELSGARQASKSGAIIPGRLSLE